MGEISVIRIFFHFLFLAGRRGDITLDYILRFVTGADEEPLLGFKMAPAIVFTTPGRDSFIPTSNTCISQLQLPCGTLSYQLPDDKKLFKLCDYAFANHYLGQA